MTTTIGLSAVALSCAAFLAACGGGGGGGGDEGGAVQAVDFAFPGGETVAIPPEIATVELVATSSSGGPVTFTSNTPDTCTVSGSTLSLLKAGECSVTATQAGGDGYAPASSSQLFVIPKRPQLISFINPGWQPLDSTPVPLTAASNLDRPITFSSSTPDVCSVSGSSMLKLANGMCVITATQDGGDIYVTPSVEKKIPIGTEMAPKLTFLSGYKADGSATAEEGSIGTFAGSNLDGWWCGDPNWCARSVSGDGSRFTFSYKMQPKDPNHPNNDGWMGGYWGFNMLAGGLSELASSGDTNTGVHIDAQAALKLRLAQNAEWFNTGSNGVNIDLILGHFALRDGNACNVKLRTTLKPSAAAAANYSVSLKSFAFVKDDRNPDKPDDPDKVCGLLLASLDVASELQTYAISKIEFSAVSVNTTVSSTPMDYPTYPTELTLTGGITFQ
ncbi:hypothetical protein [Ideonella sp. YS5]|uniref:hypothetical protein n=1 Tax=Ideonella sp. YS5 TaxID=3453714 RepID=UPI003EEA441D